jgi:hypothetical protein
VGNPEVLRPNPYTTVELPKNGAFSASLRPGTGWPEHRGAKRTIFDVWCGDPLYITIQADPEWKTHHFISDYRCLKRQELSDALQLTGFRERRWLMPAESGYYQPLVLARWP